MSKATLEGFRSRGDVEGIIDYLNKLDVKSLTDVNRIIMSQQYSDPPFFNWVKDSVRSRKGKLNANVYSLFNLTISINPDEYAADLNTLFPQMEESYHLISAILPGAIRDSPDLIAEAYRLNAECVSGFSNFDFIKRQLSYYYRGRGWTTAEIVKIFGEDFGFNPTVNPRKPIRVAFLISGQTRGLESAIESWNHFFNFDSATVDCFISTWVDTALPPTKLDWPRVSGGKTLQNLQALLKDEDTDEILCCLSSYLPPTRVTEEYLRTCLRRVTNSSSIRVEIEDERTFPDFTNSMKMYYKIHRAFELSKLVGPYDLYVRLRPDLYLSGDGLSLEYSEMDLSASRKMLAQYGYTYQYYGFGVDDKIAVMKYDVADLYCSIWNRAGSERKALSGHYNLARLLNAHAVDVEKIPGLAINLVNYNVPSDFGD